MSPTCDLLAVNERQALEFFALGLRDVSDSSVDQDELLYNASVLAHYAQVSTTSSVELSAPASLGDVFDQYIASDSAPRDSLGMEMAAAQCLLLAGFFEDQMRRRHNIRWYAQIGATFFSRAALQSTSAKRARLLDALAHGFETWRRRHANLSRELREQARLLHGWRA
jgi:hypothetical protein